MTEAIRQGDIPGVQLRCRVEIGAPPAQIWPRLAESGGVEGWLCREAELPGELEPEAGFRWLGCHGLDPDTTEEGTLLAVDPPNLWVASVRQPDWQAATRLTIELSPTASGGCSLSVLQNGFEHLPLSISLTVWEIYRRRWRSALERLAASFD